MDQTAIFSLEAIQNISQLRDVIRDLKKEVDSAEVGSEKYKQSTQNLAEAQRALKLAQTGVYDSMKAVAEASRQDADAINKTVQATKQGTATYNEMSTALGALKRQIKDIPKYLSEEDAALGKVNQKYAEANSQIQTLDTALKQLDADNGVFGRNVGNYLGALQEWGGTMGQLREVGQNLSSGILSLVGIMSIFGIETEDTKESLQAIIPILGILQAGKGFGGLVKVVNATVAGQKAAAAATTAAAAASQADAVAKGTEAVATEAADKAQKSLNASMLANPILAIVAAVAALVTGIIILVRNMNKAARETRDWAAAQDELNEKFAQQDDELERQLRINAALGDSQEELLNQKKQNIIAQKNETEALYKNIEARIQQMKADSAWVRFWKGENKAIRNLEEQLKSLTEQIKGYDKAIADIDTDIFVARTESRVESAKERAQQYTNLVKNAVSAANTAMNSQMTAAEKIEKEYKETQDSLFSGLQAITELLKDATPGTVQWILLWDDYDTIQKGLTANTERYNKALGEQNTLLAKNAFQLKTDKAFKEAQYDFTKASGATVIYERLVDAVLGFSDAQKILARNFNSSDGEDIILKQSRETVILTKSYEKLKEVLEEDIRALTGFKGELKDITASGLSWEEMLKLSQTDADALVKKVGEPLATAVSKWFATDKSLQEANIKGINEVVSQFKSLIEDAIGDNEFAQANTFVQDLRIYLLNAFAQTFDGNSKEIENAIDVFIASFVDQINEGLADDKYTLDFSKKFEALSLNGANNFDALARITSDFMETYVSSTASGLDAVANLWDESLKARYKRLVESGKMTEEEAQKQAEQSFKAVKAMQIGVAVVDTAAAVTQALADPTIPSYYVKAANAVAAAVNGAAQIVAITQTEFGTPNVKVPTPTTPTYTSAPTEMVYTYGLNAADYAAAQAQNPIRAYIVDSDVKAGLDNLNNRENETTF